MQEARRSALRLLPTARPVLLRLTSDATSLADPNTSSALAAGEGCSTTWKAARHSKVPIGSSTLPQDAESWIMC